jgi:hypothetical protein
MTAHKKFMETITADMETITEELNDLHCYLPVHPKSWPWALMGALAAVILSNHEREKPLSEDPRANFESLMRFSCGQLMAIGMKRYDRGHA